MSHAGIISKRLNVGPRKQHHVIGQGLSLPPEICTQSDPTLFEHRNFDQYPLIAPQPCKLATKVQLALIGSRPRAFQRAVDGPLLLSPLKGDAKRDFAVFAIKIQILSKKVCYKISLCENFQRQSCSYVIPLSNGP